MDVEEDTRIIHPSNIAVIHEVYDGSYSREYFEIELEKALEKCCTIIVIQPSAIGEETARWITFGNYLHKVAVFSGATSILSGCIWPQNILVQAPLALCSVLCTGLYTASWQFDHCVKYQVEKDPRKLVRLPILNALTATSPVVLVRKDDTKRKIIHCTVSIVAASICIYKLWSN